MNYESRRIRTSVRLTCMVGPRDTIPMLLAAAAYYRVPGQAPSEKAAFRVELHAFWATINSEQDRRDALNVLGWQYHRSLSKNMPVTRAASTTQLKRFEDPDIQTSLQTMLQLGTNFQDEELRTSIIYEIAHGDLDQFRRAVWVMAHVLGLVLERLPKMTRRMTRGQPESFPPLGGYRATPKWVVEEVYGPQ